MAEYYNFLRLGSHGFRQVRRQPGTPPAGSPQEIASLAPYELVSKGDGIPVFAFRSTTRPNRLRRLRRAGDPGWLVPAYTSARLDDVDVLRIVVRNGFSRDLAGS